MPWFPLPFMWDDGRGRQDRSQTRGSSNQSSRRERTPPLPAPTNTPENYVEPNQELNRYLQAPPNYYYPNYYTNPPWEQAPVPRNTDDTAIVVDVDKYEVHLEAQHFKSNEIRLQVFGENMILIEAKHAEREDDKGFISRQFNRRCIVPDGFNLLATQSRLCSDGTLIITVPKRDKIVNTENCTIIPVTECTTSLQISTSVENQSEENSEQGEANEAGCSQAASNEENSSLAKSDEEASSQEKSTETKKKLSI